MRDILRAAGTAAFVVGLLLLMLNPPSLSGAEDLVSLIAGAVALMVATATVTVWLTERDSMSEPEFERLVDGQNIYGAIHGGGGWPALLDSYAHRVNDQPGTERA